MNNITKYATGKHTPGKHTTDNAKKFGILLLTAATCIFYAPEANAMKIPKGAVESAENVAKEKKEKAKPKVPSRTYKDTTKHILASGSVDGTIYIWDLNKPKGKKFIKRLVHPQKHPIYSIEFNNFDTNILASTSHIFQANKHEATFEIRIWDILRPKDRECTQILLSGTDDIKSIKFSPFNKNILAYLDAKGIKIVDLSKPSRKKYIRIIKNPEERNISSFAFDPFDENKLVYAIQNIGNSEVMILNNFLTESEAKSIYIFEDIEIIIALNPLKKNMLACLTGEYSDTLNKITILDIATKKFITDIVTGLRLRSFEFSPFNENLIAIFGLTTTGIKKIEFWDISEKNNKKPINSIILSSKFDNFNLSPFETKTFACRFIDGTIKIYDFSVPGGKCTQILTGQKTITSLAFAPRKKGTKEEARLKENLRKKTEGKKPYSDVKIEFEQ